LLIKTGKDKLRVRQCTLGTLLYTNHSQS